VPLSQHSAKVALVVNTATEDPKSDSQFRQLQATLAPTPSVVVLVLIRRSQALQSEFEDDGFKIMAFPSNQFNHAEIGTNAEIHE
jgi:glutathione peroxidase-family protein